MAPSRRGEWMNATTRVQGDSVSGDASTHGSSSAEVADQARRLGRYLVIEPLGHGGMGIVIRAYDPKLQREVALKLLKTRDDLARARIVREARSMARLNHPNVVAVYDVEQGDDGDVVVAMELVRGTTLAEWIVESHAWREIVEAFVAAGRGLAAAHDAGLLHRDFKPSNALVGADGRVRVTDFGLARPDDALIVDATRTNDVANEDGDVTDPFASDVQVTEAGTVLGTPPYMAPEQHVPGPLCRATDQYAFCVSLWEALTHRLPFRARGDALLAAKLEGPPQWPRADDVPERIVAALRRGLAVDPAQRWPSMHELLEALVVEPERRRRTSFAVVATCTVVGALAFASMGRAPASELCRGAATRLADTWTEDRGARVEQAFLTDGAPHLVDLAPRVRAGLAAYAQDWQAAYTDACEATRIRGEQSEELLDLRMACLDRAELGLAVALDVFTAGDADALRNAQDVVAGLPPLSRCEDTEGLRAEVAPPDPADVEIVQQHRRDIAKVRTLREAASHRAALELADRTRDALASVRYAPLAVELAFERGAVHEGLAEWPAARTSYLEVVRSGSESGQWVEVGAAMRQLALVSAMREGRPTEGAGYLEAARGLAARSRDLADDAAAQNCAGIILRDQGKLAEAEAEHRSALAIREQVFGPRHVSVAQSLTNLAVVLEARGEVDAAEAAFRRALEIQTELWGRGHPSVARARHGLAGIRRERGDYPGAEAEFRAALAIKVRALGADHPEVASSLANLGIALSDQGRYAEAREHFDEALRIVVAANGPDHPDVATVRSDLAEVLFELGDLRGAERECRAALVATQTTYGANHPKVASVRNNLANVLDSLGESEQAGREYAAAARGLEASLGSEHALVATAYHNLATYQESQGRRRDAEATYRRALAMRERALGPDHPLVAETLDAMVDVLVAGGEREEALAVLERAWTIRRDHEVPAEDRGRSAFALARMLWSDRNGRARARELATRAREELGKAENGDTTEVDAWLARHR